MIEAFLAWYTSHIGTFSVASLIISLLSLALSSWTYFKATTTEKNLRAFKDKLRTRKP